MTDVKLTELFDRFNAALEKEQDIYEASEVFGVDGYYDTGYMNGLRKAYRIFCETALDYLKEVMTND